MTDLRNQRRLAAEILKCGVNRVWVDEDRMDEIAKAVTRNDIRILIKGGAITKRPEKGISTGRKKKLKMQKEKGRRRGHGSRRGAKYARFPRKRRWIITIRSVRKVLKLLKEKNLIDKKIYRKYYLSAKGGSFRSKEHLLSHLVSDKVIKEEDKKKILEELKKQEEKKTEKIETKKKEENKRSTRKKTKSKTTGKTKKTSTKKEGKKE
ncbi:MAG: 50S ribosomal protein L19e [Thermoplasmata archaeon]|nr:50S ribosomal protein L19e [Thermoplasmata archaeon]